MNATPITQDEARAANMLPLTVPYELPKERDMALAELARLRAAGIDAAFVRVSPGIEIWRTGLLTTKQRESRINHDGGSKWAKWAAQ